MWSDVLTKPQQGSLFKRMRAELMNIAVDYDNDLERKDTHPKLLPEEVTEVPAEAVGILRKSEEMRAVKKVTTGGNLKVSASKRVTRTAPPARRRSVLSDDKIAKLRERIERARESRSSRIGKWAVERAVSDEGTGAVLKQ